MLKKTALILFSMALFINGQYAVSMADSKEASLDLMDGRTFSSREGFVREGLNVYTMKSDTSASGWMTPGWYTRGITGGSDLDQDGRKEVFITDYLVHGVHVYEVTDDNTLEWVVSFEDPITTFSTTPRHVITGDLDQNGRGEIIFLEMSNPEEGFNGINVCEWDGVPGSDTYYRYVLPIGLDGPQGGTLDRYNGNRPLNIGDIDNDGMPELMISNNGLSNGSDVFLIGSVMGEFESGDTDIPWEYINVRALSGDFNGSPWGQPNFGDMDGDGLNEAYFLAWDHATLLTVEVEDWDVYMPQNIIFLDTAYTDKAIYGTTYVSDLDGDGHDELYAATDQGGWLYRITAGDDVSQIGFSSGDIQIYPDSNAYWDVTGGDVDGDGIDEIFTIDFDHARVTQWDWDGSSLIPTTLVEWPDLMGGFSLDFAGDLDGDGYPELLQGFLEAPYSPGNPEGFIFAVIEFTDFPLPRVEFNVNMSVQQALGDFNPNFDLVELRGTFNDWGSDSMIAMQPIGGGGIYRATVDFSQFEINTVHEFKYVIVKPAEDIWEAQDANRSFVYAGGTMALDPVYFNDVTDLDQAAPWTVQIMAFSALLGDTSNSFGTHPDASTGYDAGLDIPEPPQPPTDYLQLYFPHPDWDVALGPNFSTDIRESTSLFNNILSWEFEVATDLVDTPISLDFSPGAGLPYVLTFTLEDLMTGATHDLNAEPQYSYNSGGGGIHQFRVNVGETLPHQLSHSLEPGWHLISIPLLTDYADPEVLFGAYSDQAVYSFAYQPGTGYSQPTNIEQGHGYWLGTLGAMEVQLQGIADTSSFALALNQGWNLIGNPYSYPKPVGNIKIELQGELVNFSTAVQNGWISNTLFGFEAGSYTLAERLEPWGGYWLTALEEGLTLQLDFFEQPSDILTTPVQRSEEEWYLAITAEQAAHADLITQIGVHPDASLGFDPSFDQPEPPSPPTADLVSAFFLHTNWNSVLGSRYNRDIRPPIYMDEQQEWLLTINSAPGEVVLRWETLQESLPEHIHFRLTDVTQDVSINFSEQDSYEFNNATGSSDFVIRAYRSLVDVVAVDLPTTYCLNQNYPNPFNPTTTINYAIPVDSEVAISIYDISGKLVYSRSSQQHPAGYHNFQWNGQDDQGHALGTGVYLCRMQSTGFSQTIKMVYLK